VLQAFGWQNLRERDRDPRIVLYPSRAQLRLMACQSIVHGPNGLIWWGLRHAAPEAPVWDDLAAVTRELRTLDRELAGEHAELPVRIEYHDTGHSLDRGIEWIARWSKDGCSDCHQCRSESRSGHVDRAEITSVHRDI
jgi:hypothetical protein